MGDCISFCSAKSNDGHRLLKSQIQVLNYWYVWCWSNHHCCCLRYLFLKFTVKNPDASVLHESSCNTDFNTKHVNESVFGSLRNHCISPLKSIKRGNPKGNDKWLPFPSRAQTGVFFKARLFLLTVNVSVCTWRPHVLHCMSVNTEVWVSVSSGRTRGSYVGRLPTDHYTHQIKSTLITRRSIEMTCCTCSSYTGCCSSLLPPHRPSAC